MFSSPRNGALLATKQISRATLGHKSVLTFNNSPQGGFPPREAGPSWPQNKFLGPHQAIKSVVLFKNPSQGGFPPREAVATKQIFLKKLRENFLKKNCKFFSRKYKKNFVIFFSKKFSKKF